MINDLKPYPSMKDSGLPWLGELPEHWEVHKLRNLLNPVTERNRSDLSLLSVVREKGVIQRDTTNKDENRNFIPDDLTNYKAVRVGQFAMNKMKAWQGSYGVSPHEGIVSPAYFVFDLTGVAGDFFNLAIRSRAYVPFFAQASDGVRIGQWDLAQARMKEIPFFVPSLTEQDVIVRFLGHADRRIRRYMLAKQKLIKLLEEQKQAIIHRAVTRGLDPNVRLKPSGIEWLGDVPGHWKVVALKRVSQIIDGDRGSEYPTVEDFRSEGIPFLSSKSIKDGRLTFKNSPFISQEKFQVLREGKLKTGDIVITVRGTIGNSAVFNGDLYDTAFINAQMMILRPNCNRILPAYLLQLTQSRYFKELLAFRAYGSAQQQLTNQILSVLPLPVPPIQQQGPMLDALENLLKIPETLLDRAHREISILREYRIRLIADVVTGKLDVRAAAARLPEQTDESELLDDAEALAEGDEETEDGDLDVVTEEVEA